MKKTLLPLFLLISLISCSDPMDKATSLKEVNYKKTYVVTVDAIKQYDDGFCDLVITDNANVWGKGRYWLTGKTVKAEDCDKMNIGDKLMVTETFKDGKISMTFKKLSSKNSNPNLP